MSCLSRLQANPTVSPRARPSRYFQISQQSGLCCSFFFVIFGTVSDLVSVMSDVPSWRVFSDHFIWCMRLVRVKLNGLRRRVQTDAFGLAEIQPWSPPETGVLVFLVWRSQVDTLAISDEGQFPGAWPRE